MKTSLIFWVVIFISACQSSITHNIYDYEEEFELAIGKEIKVGTQKISAEFINVLEVSRSPEHPRQFKKEDYKVRLQFLEKMTLLILGSSDFKMGHFR